MHRVRRLFMSRVLSAARRQSLSASRTSILISSSGLMQYLPPPYRMRPSIAPPRPMWSRMARALRSRTRRVLPMLLSLPAKMSSRVSSSASIMRPQLAHKYFKSFQDWLSFETSGSLTESLPRLMVNVPSSFILTVSLSPMSVTPKIIKESVARLLSPATLSPVWFSNSLLL